MSELEGRLIVITGAAGGIGAAVARMAAERGARLLLVDPNEKGLDDLLRTLPGAGHAAAPSFLESPQACADVLARVDGPLYGLVHMAGIFVPHELEPGARDVYDRTIAANMTNAFDLVCAMVARLVPTSRRVSCLRVRRPIVAAASGISPIQWLRAALPDWFAPSHAI